MKTGVAINECKFDFKEEIWSKIEISNYAKIIRNAVRHRREAQKRLVERAQAKKEGFEKIKSSETTAAGRKV